MRLLNSLIGPKNVKGGFDFFNIRSSVKNCNIEKLSKKRYIRYTLYPEFVISGFALNPVWVVLLSKRTP